MELPIVNMQIIQPDDLNRSLVSIETNELFLKVKDYLKENFKRDLSDFEHKGISYDTELDSNMKAEIHVFEDSNSFVSLIFGVTSLPEGNNLNTARFSVIVEDDVLDINYDHDTNNFVVVHKEKVNGTAKDTWKEIKDRNHSGLIEDLENSITPLAFGDFCLPGGYEYCGKECGTNGDKGGGGAIYNKVDGCCYVHDKCYGSNKTNRCVACDRPLVNCVSTWANYKEGPVAASSIIAFFKGKCDMIIM